jgi:hypothetical protein
MFTAVELVAEAERELKLRRRVYPNRVFTRRLSPQQAAKQIAMMEAIRDILRERAAEEDLFGRS